MLSMMFFSWQERIYLVLKGILKVSKRDNRLLRWSEWLGQLKMKWVMSQTIMSLWNVQREETFIQSLKEWEGSRVWPKRRRENDTILLLERLRMSNQGNGEMVGNIFCTRYRGKEGMIPSVQVISWLCKS